MTTDVATVAAQRREPAPPAAATAMVERHLRGLWRYLRTLGADATLADDLAQEAFVVALRKGAASFAPAAAAAFLRRTARFLFLHHLRDRRDLVELADAVDELWAHDATALDGEPDDARLEHLRTCVAALEGRARRAVQLCYGPGAEQPSARVAAATELGLQHNGLKTLLQRVRQTLRACIERRMR